MTTHSLQISGLQSNTTYYFRVTSAAGEAHVATSPDPPVSPQSFQTQPSAPVLTGTIPSSPANANSPKVVGSAVAGSTVRIYAGADCSGSVIATSSALALEAGIEVAVADNSSSSSTPPPAMLPGRLRARPRSPMSRTRAPRRPRSTPSRLVPSNSSSASFAFSGTDTGGSGVASASSAAATVPPSLPAPRPQAYAGLADGSHSFEVRAVDQAGNVDATPASSTWTVDTVAPTTSIGSGPPALTQHRRRQLHLLRHRHRRLWRGVLPVPPRRRRLRCLHDAAGLLGPCRRLAYLRSPGARPGRQRRCHPCDLDMVDRHHRAQYRNRFGPAGAERTAPPPASPSPAPTPAALAWRPSSAAATAPPSLPARRRRPTRALSTARIPSKSGRSTRPATSMPPLRPRHGSIDTTAPNTAIDWAPPGLSNSAAASFTFSGTDTGGSGVASLPVPARPTQAADWGSCTSPRNLCLARRRLAYLRSPGARPGRKCRRDPGARPPGRSTPRPDHLDRLGPAEAERIAPRPASPSPAPTPTALAWCPSNAAATAPPSLAARRRRPTRGLPTARITSK